ncbi:hypothetical protein GCM10023091_29830 [Ravibacter arvi]|uniref:Outer membrane protein beta-barrel domain-containing protein n=1 Tax=Ravibacter arvi TaxID=2051041 RepID=A0ABP8M4N5_9BACT
MKKLFAIFVMATAVFAGTNAHAQFEKGDKLLNAGVNLGGTYGGGGVGLGASFEAGVHDFISVGAQLDWVSWNYGWTGYKWKYNFTTIAARGSYHFGKHFLQMDNLDLYAGPAIGYRISKYKDPSGYSGPSYVSSYDNGVFFGAFAGARYYFKENLGVFAEVGYNASPLKAGITLKF